MSRWIEQYENHPFHQIWDNLKTNLASASVDDQTVVTSVKELARLKKVISFVDGMINSLDPELVPMNTWDNFNSQATPCNQHIINFNSNRNINHLQSANAHADNLLTYIRPYMIVEGKAGKILKESAKQYSDTIEKYIGSFQSKSSELLGEIKSNKDEVDNLQENIQNISELAEDFSAKLFGNEENTDCIQTKINDLVQSIVNDYGEINAYHNETLVGDATNPSTQELVSKARDSILAKQSEITELLDDVSQKVKDLESFHIKIFGKQNDDDELSGGLSEEFEQRIKALGEFEKKQTTKYNALNQQIETLLPGATSAGLATAYKEMKESFNTSIKYASIAFYVSIGALVFASSMLALESVGGEHWVTFVKFDNWDSVLKGLVYKIPFYAPVIWLAFYATKRRSEAQRLQQEYAHKEALAKSYDNYKKQLELLDDEDRLMQKEFIMKAIDAIAYNASQTLDGKHGDDHPTMDMLDKVMDTVTQIKGAVSK